VQRDEAGDWHCTTCDAHWPRSLNDTATLDPESPQSAMSVECVSQTVKPIIPDSVDGVVRNDRTGEERAVTCHFISGPATPGSPPTNSFLLALDGRRWTAESVSGDTFTLQLEDGREFRVGTVQANGLLTIAGELP
jgi:hypothetical protein